MRRVLGPRGNLTASLVIAMGAVMVSIGIFAICYGNNYITVERGWSTFIAGSVLLTGGLLTIGLGLAIRALGDLKLALMAQAVPIPADIIDSEPSFAGFDFGNSAPAARTVAPPVEPGSAALAATLVPEMVLRPPFEESSFDHPHVAQPETDTTWHDRARSAAPDTRETAAQDERAYANFAPVELEAINHLAADHVAGAEIGHDLHPAVEPPPPPNSDDWLDRNFADLDREFDLPPEHVPPEHASPEQTYEHDGPAPATVPHLESEDAHLEPAEHEREHAQPLHHEEPEPAPQYVDLTHEHPGEEEAPPTAPASPVIGRYEAEGTSYVMYADGSIEAQSEAGVYRFASMAELKSFIET